MGTHRETREIGRRRGNDAPQCLPREAESCIIRGALKAEYDEKLEQARDPDWAIPPPPKQDLAPLFPLPLDGQGGGLTDSGQQIIHWLVKHLGSVEFVEWLISKMRLGKRPHKMLRYYIRERLAEPHTLTDGFVRFWRIVSSEGDWATGPLVPYRSWNLRNSLHADTRAPWVKQELLAALRPILLLTPSLYQSWRETADAEGDPEPIGTHLSEIADARVVLACENQVRQIIRAIDDLPSPDAIWAGYIDELTQLMRQVIDLYAVAGEVDLNADPSAIHRPSIVPHAQNDHHIPWTVLFDLIWRAWLYIDASDESRSRLQIACWQQIPYLAFQRLVLAAINHSEHFSAQEKLDALLNARA